MTDHILHVTTNGLCAVRAYEEQTQRKIMRDLQSKGLYWTKTGLTMGGGGTKRERKKKTASILSGIHYRDSRGMVWINPSDAFSVLLTFSVSPKRQVLCQRAFIKLDQRENNVKTHCSP